MLFDVCDSTIVIMKFFSGDDVEAAGLHDALAECCPEAAAELAKETRVFKGYWVLDLLLGKE